MAIWLAQLSVDRWRLSNGLKRGEGADAHPTALIAETAHGPGVEAANAAAKSQGVNAGMMLADARTLCPKLAVHPADPAGDLEALEKTALWAQRWGPWSTVDAPDGVIVDVTGAAHLFGGEDRLMDDVQTRFAARDMNVRAAIAPTAGAAWALAHYGTHCGQSGHNSAILAPDEDMPGRLSGLPVAALRLDPDVLTVLRRLGLKRLGDLDRVESSGTNSRRNMQDNRGRDALQRRFRHKFRAGMKGRTSPGSNPLVRMDQLLGRVPEPLLPIIPHDMPLVQRRLVEPIRHRALLDQVLSDLAQDMGRVLEGLGEGARRLGLGLWRVDGEVIIRTLEMAAATRDPTHMIRLLSSRLEDIDAGFGIESVRLRASWAQPVALSQDNIEDAVSDVSSAISGTSLAACVDRLTVKLGQQAVTKPAASASHLPERGQIWQPPLDTQSPHQKVLGFHKRPLKLLDKKEKISVHYDVPDGFPQSFTWRGSLRKVIKAEGPERIAPEWWREKSTARLRDYYRIEDAEGCRYWIYRQGTGDDGRGGAPQWFMHGLFG
ncbi:MAG: DNA polymerase Y family protein [Marinomonas sp.]